MEEDDEDLKQIENAAKNTAKKVAKKTARKAAKIVKKIVKKAAKTVGKAILKFIFSPIGIKIILVVAIVLFLAWTFVYVIKNIKFDSILGIINNNGQAVVNIDVDNRQYKISQEFLDRINAMEVDVSNELIRKLYEAEVISTLPDIREREKIGTPISEGEIQGKVKIKRQYYDGTEEYIEYMKYEEFMTEAAKFGNYELLDESGNVSTQAKVYNDSSSVTKNYNEFKRYFTLDSEYNLIIATISTKEVTNKYNDFAKKERRKLVIDGEEERYIDERKDNDQASFEYELKIKRENYKDSVYKYALPVEFNLTMLLVSQNEEFCEAVIDLAKETDIVIKVFDNLTTIVTEEKYGYTADFKYEKEVEYEEAVLDETKLTPTMKDKLQGFLDRGDKVGYQNYLNSLPKKWEKKTNKPGGNYTEQKDISNPFSTVTTVTKEYLTSLFITDVKSWIADISNIYTNEEEMTENQDKQELENVDYKKLTTYYVFHDELFDDLKNLPDTAGRTRNEKILSREMKEKQTEREIVTTTKMTTNFYKKTATSNEDSGPQARETRFLSLLKVDPTTSPEQFNMEDKSKNTKKVLYEDENGNYSSPINNILENEVRMYELLASREKTQGYEEVMRYLLYILTGKSRGVETLDFSIYEPGRFSSTTGDYVGSDCEEKVWFALINAGYNEYAAAGAMGNIKKESGFRSNNLQNSYESSLGSDEEYTRKVNEGEYSLDQFVNDSAGYGLVQWTYCSRKENLYKFAFSEKMTTIDDENMQIEFMLKELEAYSYAKDQPDYNTAAVRFHDSYENSADGEEGINERKEYAKELYEKYSGRQAPTSGGQYPLSGGNINMPQIQNSDKIVNWALAQVGKSTFYNRYQNENISSRIHCASFVKSARYEAGILYPAGNAKDLAHPYPVKYTSDGRVDCSNVPAGAYIVSLGSLTQYGHVALYIGDGYVIEAGGNTIVKRKIDESSGSRNKFLGWGI